MSFVDGLLSAVGLLTRVPVATSRLPGAGVAWFPLVGGLIGLFGGAVYWLGHLVAPPLLASTIAFAAFIWLTGGLHEDGLADYADALGSGRTGEGALDVMADPRIGTFGAIALILSLVWRVAAVSSLEPAAAMVWLVVANSLSRSGAATLAGMLPAARSDGLGRTVTGESHVGGRLLAALGGVAIALAAGVWGVLAVLVAAGSVLAVRTSARALLGGLTGDVLGACEQMIEVLVLTLAVAVTALPAPPWSGLL